jgi:DNA-binding response OmpR family regulator
MVDLRSRRILVVEDEYALADELANGLDQGGAVVIGPVATVAEALVYARTELLDGAILDINLGGEMAYEVAERLEARAVPFVFLTGYDASSIPARYRHVRRVEKPCDLEEVTAALFS